MQKNKVLKQLLAVSAFAAMFGAFQAHAQTSSSTTPSIQELNKANTGKSNMDGKTARDGTVGNTNSQGMDERDIARNEQATSATGTSGQGSTGSGTSGQGSTASGTSGQGSTSSGTSASQGSTGGGASPAQSSAPVGATGASDAQGSMATGGQTGTQGSGGATGAAGQSSDKTATGASGSSGQGMSGQTSSGAGAAGQAAAGASGKLSKADQRAVMDMARANMAEIEAAKLALSKSQDDQVKSYAQQMIDDHTTALTEVQTLAQARGVTLPTEPDSKHKAMAAKMEKLSGDAFNREYMRQAGVADHKRVLSMLQKEQKSAKDPDVKALATKMLPTVEQHLKAAQAVPVAKSGTTSGK